jgi:hypothetical protein
MASINLDVDGINHWGNPHPDIKDGDCLSVLLEKSLPPQIAFGSSEPLVYSKITVYLHSDTLEGFRVFAQGILDQLPKVEDQS